MSKNSNEETLGYGRGWKVYYTEAPNELFDERCTLTPIQTMVYLYLLSCVNIQKNGGCVAWPSHTTIAKHIRASRRGVQEATYVLIEKGYMFKKSRRSSDGTRMSNMYLLNYPSTAKDFTD